MSRFPATPRGNRYPPTSGAVNIMCVSDIHMEDPLNLQVKDFPYIALADLNVMTRRETVAAWVMAGDLSSRANASEMVLVKSWLDAWNRDGKPLAMVPGNHDLIGTGTSGGVPDIFTPEQWATYYAAYGVTGRDYVIDVPDTDLRILCVSPAANPAADPLPLRMAIDDTVLAWCDARISETTRRCLIVHHAPLMDTILAKPGVPYTSAYTTSTTANWYVRNRSTYTVEQMVASHPNLIAWISGHLHSEVDAPDVVKRNVTTGGVFASISVSSPRVLPVGSSPQVASAMVSVYPDRIEVRYRDHGMGQWLNPVHTVSLSS